MEFNYLSKNYLGRRVAEGGFGLIWLGKGEEGKI